VHERTFSKTTVHSIDATDEPGSDPDRGERTMMSYYKRLLGQSNDRTGGPSLREANDDFARMLNQRYSLFGPLTDQRGRHHR
jgi:hypothetical protein